MSDATPPPPTAPTPPAPPSGPTGGISWALVAGVAVAAVVAFVAAFAVAGATEGDPAPAPTADQVFDAAGGAAEVPVLAPTSSGGFVRTDLLAAQAVGEGELADEPLPGAGPAVPVEEGSPATPDVVVEDPSAPGDAGAVPLEAVPPAAPAPTVLIAGLDEAPAPLERPATDDVDGSPELPSSDPTADAGAGGGAGGGADPEGTATTTDTVVSASDEVIVEIPAVIDPCAVDGEERPVGCGPGIGGTIIPTDHDVLVVREVTSTPGERCADQLGSVPRDRIPVVVLTNDRAALELTYRPVGTDDEARTVEVTTPESEAAYAERDEPVQTCVLLDRVGDVAWYDVTATPTSLVDEATALPWVGMVAVPDDGGRPPVTITPADDRRLEVYVPAAAAEEVEVWTIPRTADVTTSRCGELDELRSGEDVGSLGMGLHREVARASLPSFGMWDPSIDSLRQHDVWFRDEDATDLCVIWFRDLSPTREVVERQSWLLLPPAHPEAQVVATGFVDAAGRGARLHGGDYDGVIVNIDAPPRAGLCSAAAVRDEVEAGVEDLLCSFEVTPERSQMLLEMGPIGGPGIPDPGAYRAVLELDPAPCYETGPGACTDTYAAGIPGPPVDGERTILGTFEFEVRYSDAPLRSEEWVISSTGTFDTPEAERPDRAQLDLGATRVTAHPTDPFKVVVEWRADRAIQSVAIGGEALTSIPCRSNTRPDAVRDSAATVFEGDHGRQELWVCPGTPYAFSVGLYDGATTTTWTPTPDGDEGPRPELPWREGTYRTAPVDLRLWLDLTTRATFGLPGGLGPTTSTVPLQSAPARGPVLPSSAFDGLWDIRYTSVQVGDELRRPEEGYGRFECGSSDHHDLSVSEPFEVTVGPQVPIRVSSHMYRFPACGLFGNVPTTAGGPWAEWWGSIAYSVPVLDLLEAEQGWRLQDFHWTWPDMWAPCEGQDHFRVSSAPDTRQGHQDIEALREAIEGPDEEEAADDGPRAVGGAAVEAGSCNPDPSYRLAADIRTERAGVVYSADGGVATAAGG